jgi:hypothetical protein
MIAVYENECKRPGREKLYSTIDMIEKYEQLNLLNLLKERTLDMIDRRERISLTIDAFEEGCAIIENGITVMRSEKRIKCIFFDGTSIQYDSVDDSVIIEKPDFRYEKLFSFLPNLFELHMVYKNIDYDLKAYEIQKQFPDIDFSPIEEKYNSMLGLAIVRITSIGIIIWLIPTLIVFLIIKYELIHKIYRLYSRFQNIIKNMFRKIVYARGSE